MTPSEGYVVNFGKDFSDQFLSGVGKRFAPDSDLALIFAKNFAINFHGNFLNSLSGQDQSFAVAFGSTFAMQFKLFSETYPYRLADHLGADLGKVLKNYYSTTIAIKKK